MKNYLNKLGLLVLLFSLSACGLFELDEFLVDPSNVAPENSETSLVMNRAMFDFVDFVDEASDETMPYTRINSMTGGVLYQNQDSPSSFDELWTRGYASLMPDLDLVIAQSDEGGFTLVAGAARTMKAYVLYTLVDLFGDIPFSEAQQGIANPSPRADDDAAVYMSATGILDQAIADLSSPAGSFDNDLYYGGDAASWLNLANTLKLRMLVQTKLVNAESASGINSIVSGGNIIDAIDEDFEWQYGTSNSNPDSRHPFFITDYENGGNNYQSNYFMWIMFGEKVVTDPRLRYYFYRQDCDETDEDNFTLQCASEPYPAHWAPGFPFCTASGDSGDPSDRFSGYWGRDHGNADGIPPDDLKRTIWGLYPAGGQFDADDCEGGSRDVGARGAGIQPIMLSSWTHFLLAEAALTVDGVNGDPKELMLEGVRQSITKVTGFRSDLVDGSLAATDDDVEAYLTTVGNLYDAAADDDERLQVIMKEYWIASHGMGLDVYNAYRRTGKPDGLVPTEEAAPGEFPRSFWYPANYVNRNENAGQKSDLSGQIFWDTNPATGWVD